MIRKHNIIWFYIFTFGFTIILGGTAQILFTSSVPEQYQTIVSLILLEMAPTLGALLVCIIMKDWNCFKNMNWNPLKNINNILWLLLSFIIPIAIVTSASAIMSASGIPYISNGYSNKLIIVIILASLIGCIGEEVGWRGFMLPSFNRKYSLISSAVFTGILWGVWHLGKLTSYGIQGYLLFILLITELSVIMAWIYTNSSRSVICMIFFHLGVNTSSLLLLTEREGIMFYTAACTISALICLVLVFADRKKFCTKLLSYEL